MENNKMFELATRNKIRFPYRGMISVEDLWDLNVEALDSIFKTLNAGVKQAQEESLLNRKTKEDETLALMIEIVKYIVSVKLAEAEHRKTAKEKREKKEKLMSILAEKQEKDLYDKSMDEIQKMLAELED